MVASISQQPTICELLLILEQYILYSAVEAEWEISRNRWIRDVQLATNPIRLKLYSASTIILCFR